MSKREVTISLMEDGSRSSVILLTIDGHTISFAWLVDDRWALNLSMWELEDVLGFASGISPTPGGWFDDMERIGEVLERILALDRDHLEKLY